MTVISIILRNRILEFINKFNSLSREVYYHSEGKLIHPNEFGGFRESLVAELLKVFVPMKYTITDGFLVNSKNEVSTQCDILIFSKDKTSFTVSENYQKFFIAQSVSVIGEVKSILSSSSLKNSLIKLAKNKQLRLSTKSTNINQLPYNEQVLSFLICEKIDMKMENIKDIFDNSYKYFPDVCKHNFILSLEDGLFTYYVKISDNNTNTLHYSSINGESYSHLKITADNKEHYIQLFCSYINQHLESYKDEDFDLLDHLPKDETEKIEYSE